jgi:alkanesulfonate monooxygenase SsuD/methylene tetrahydromethanopterin reductase-like flavin-dependent oxidoreductase (luciferase family)
MADDNKLSFGIKTSQAGIDYQDLLRLWLEAEQIELFEHAWLWDHMIPLRGPVDAAALEAWTLLSALAVQTRRLRLGVIVTSNRLRPPALLAKMAATVDQISGGRLEFGIGAGGALIAGSPFNESVQREFGAYGIPIVPAAEAVAALGEACELIRRMWTQSEPFDFDGRYYQLTGAVCSPKPVQQPHPPITIGGGGEKVTLRVVAEHADIWNCPGRTADEFKHKNAVLDQHCVAIGRDPAEITRSMQLLVPADDPGPTRDKVLELIEAGVRHVVLAPLGPHREGHAHWLADEIIQPVLAQIPAI